MKKLLLMAFAFFCITQLLAQDSKEEKSFRFGLTISPNVGWMKPDAIGYAKKGAKLGYSYGLMAEFSITDNYLFATGISLPTISGSFTKNVLNYAPTPSGDSVRNNAQFDYKLQYVCIPLTLKMKTKDINKMRFYGQFGVEPGFNINQKVNAAAGPNEGITVNPNNSSSEFKDFNDNIGFIRASLVVGGGMEYSLGGSTSLVGGLSFNNGFIDISKEKTLKLTNSFVSLNLGILF